VQQIHIRYVERIVFQYSPLQQHDAVVDNVNSKAIRYVYNTQNATPMLKFIHDSLNNQLREDEQQIVMS